MEIDKIKDIELDFIKYRVLYLKLQNKSLYEVLRDSELKRFNLSDDLVKDIYSGAKDKLKQDTEILNEFTKLRELMKIELVEKEAWDVFNKSKAGVTEVIQKETDKGLETIHKTKNNSENMKALEVILDCIKEKNRVLGHIAPVRNELSGAIELKDLKINYIVPVEEDE